MVEYTPINEVEPGMILIGNNDEQRYVVIDTNLNGEDDFYSQVAIISEEEFIKYKGNKVAKSELKTFRWIEKYEYNKEFSYHEEYYTVSSEKVFRFD